MADTTVEVSVVLPATRPATVGASRLTVTVVSWGAPTVTVAVLPARSVVVTLKVTRPSAAGMLPATSM